MSPLLLVLATTALTWTVPTWTVPTGLPAQDPPPVTAGTTPTTIRALVIEQEAQGLPNQPTEDLVLQRIIIAEDRLRLEDLNSGIVYLLRLDQDPPTLFEVSHDGKKYREGRELDQLQRERDRMESQALERLRGEPEMKRRALMEELFLRPGRAREVTVKPIDGERTILERTARRYEVRENDRVIVDAWIADENLGIPFYEFYRRVGAFSNEVLERLKEIPGLPLEVDFTVVTATLSYTIEVRARAVMVDEVPARIFEIPPGAEKVEESPFANCPICGTQVERDAPPAGKSIRRDGTEVFFDTKNCKADFNRREFPERFPPKKP